jgi:hypothetical protein
MRIDTQYCRCNVCTRFYPGQVGWQTGIPCDVCGRPDLRQMTYVPSVIQEFLGISRLCYFCRNGIHASVFREWDLCFADSREDMLKWALVDWVRSHVWFSHWYMNKHHGQGHYPPVGLCQANLQSATSQ